MEDAVQHLDRRPFMSLFAGLGLAGTTLPHILWAQAGGDAPLTDADVAAAARLAGLELTAEERELMMTSLDQLREDYQALRRVAVDNSVPQARIFEEVDVYVSPTFGGDNLLLTNLIGHPAVVVPNGFPSDGSPSSITFTGGLHREAEVLAVARAFQEATGHHLRRPPVGSEVKS